MRLPRPFSQSPSPASEILELTTESRKEKDSRRYSRYFRDSDFLLEENRNAEQVRAIYPR